MDSTAHVQKVLFATCPLRFSDLKQLLEGHLEDVLERHLSDLTTSIPYGKRLDECIGSSHDCTSPLARAKTTALIPHYSWEPRSVSSQGPASEDHGRVKAWPQSLVCPLGPVVHDDDVDTVDGLLCLVFIIFLGVDHRLCVHLVLGDIHVTHKDSFDGRGSLLR